MPTEEVVFFDTGFSMLNPSKSCCRDICGVCCFLLSLNVPILESHVSLPYLRLV